MANIQYLLTVDETTGVIARVQRVGPNGELSDLPVPGAAQGSAPGVAAEGLQAVVAALGPRPSPGTADAGAMGPRPSPGTADAGAMGPRPSPGTADAGAMGPRPSPGTADAAAMGPRPSPGSSDT